MRTNNDRIVSSALKAWGGQLKVENSSGGWCLKVVREIVQDGLGISYNEFYSRYMTHKATGTDPNVPFARDVQFSLRQQGKNVKVPMPGDLGFTHLPMPWGHVVILVSPNIVLENVDSPRPFAKNGYLGLSYVDTLGRSLEWFRL